MAEPQATNIKMAAARRVMGMGAVVSFLILSHSCKRATQAKQSMQFKTPQ
jgi:hypothetical protein